MFAKHPSFSTGAVLVLGTTVALLLVWWVLVAGLRPLLDVGDTGDPDFAQILQEGAAPAPDVAWREQIARNPTDARLYRKLAEELETQDKRAEAQAAYEQALRLDPTHPRVLLVVAHFYLRSDDAARALPLLRRVVDLYPALGARVWPTFAAELESGRGSAFLLQAARENATWWAEFFRHICNDATNADLLATVFTARVDAGVVTNDERHCLIGRMQRAGRWVEAHELWRNSLPLERQGQAANVFNGGFEWPPSNVGFDWIVPGQDGATVETLSIEGAQGSRALRVTFVNRRYAGPPIYQNLMLRPGRYRLDGLRRADGLESWLGLQWGVYCVPEGDAAPRQLARTEPFVGSQAWSKFRREFTVPAGCAMQVLRLELANPRRDAESPGNVAARLRGTLWFDDLEVTALD